MHPNLDEPNHACRFSLAELAALYDARALGSLIARALDQLRRDGTALDAHLAAGAFAEAAHVLHKMKGTVSFFAQDECPLAALHSAEAALRLGDRGALAAALPEARRVFAALEQTLAAHLARSAQRIPPPTL
ncbi:hypothetical protein WKR88_17980 [Trinickia caryophylli]|uniref:Hpt domain-containing protein n=1 Tax=Trinickia caryophylli TaxID=28094 RepID=A0A1X7DZN4_TRICW|nr:hypothetical protein [Trinickia caryophylli]PMS14121.1 hypothetical protein C0Z17_00850 [Trinickia caryophylli]TRX17820.1 hypothetical protein FNF07_05990 [Trinickia caryophylli]WQE11412.1 hypothetical protein U0034_16920 [Trinickia caryophylli]SMF24298.1 hypothetical protein SAMN06295900_104269 [Trinickia caryophylli]GLU32574.1 hypothetical protein Busp01_24160 [Trinickia caryophylli]